MYREKMMLLSENEIDNQQEHWKIEERAYRRAYEKILYDSFLLAMESDRKKYFKKDNFSNIEFYNNVKALIKERGRKWGYLKCCFTVKKENDHVLGLRKMISMMEKMSKWKWIKCICWNIEWRDHKGDGEGLHSHALIGMIDSKRYSQAKKQLINWWKDMGYAQILPTNDKNRDYIKGIKRDDKMKKVYGDMKLRKEYDLNDYVEDGKWN